MPFCGPKKRSLFTPAILAILGEPPLVVVRDRVVSVVEIDEDPFGIAGMGMDGSSSAGPLGMAGGWVAMHRGIALEEGGASVQGRLIEVLDGEQVVEAAGAHASHK